jgi:hypothetical protein
MSGPRWFVILGAAVYAISFCLPAVWGKGVVGEVPGWVCARFTLAALPGASSDGSWLYFACGVVNPLAVAYLALRVAGQAPRTRRVFAILALILIPLSWVVMAKDLLMPHIGHVAWIGGLWAMLTPEAFGVTDVA